MVLPLEATQELQRIPNAAAGVPRCSNKCDAVAPLFRALHWLPIPIRFHIFSQLSGVVMFQVLKGLRLGYLQDHLHYSQPSRVLQSISAGGVITPQKEAKLMSLWWGGLLGGKPPPLQLPPFTLRPPGIHLGDRLRWSSSRERDFDGD